MLQRKLHVKEVTICEGYMRVTMKVLNEMLQENAGRSYAENSTMLRTMLLFHVKLCLLDVKAV
jgi:hypothetical protein